MTTILVAVFAVLLHQKPACAYLDPGTGSYAAQMLFAGALVGTYSLRSFFRRMFDMVSTRFKH